MTERSEPVLWRAAGFLLLFISVTGLATFLGTRSAPPAVRLGVACLSALVVLTYCRACVKAVRAFLESQTELRQDSAVHKDAQVSWSTLHKMTASRLRWGRR